MPTPELPLVDRAQTKLGAKQNYSIEMLHYGETAISLKNPRYGYAISDASVAPLVAEFGALGQVHDAIGERRGGDVVEILAGSRRREVCRILNRPLRVKIMENLSPIEALKIANREDRGALEVSLWDKSASWSRMLDLDPTMKEGQLADAVGEDKSAISRGLALQKAPPEILGLVADRRAISMTQWALLAPLLEDPDKRERVLDAAALLAGQTLAITTLTQRLVAAAAGKSEIKPQEVKNRHGKVIATIKPDHRGAFTIRVKSMTEHHPNYRNDHAKIIHTAFVELLKQWFDEV